MMRAIGREELVSSLQQLKQTTDCVVFSNDIRQETTQEIQVKRKTDPISSTKLCGFTYSHKAISFQKQKCYFNRYLFVFSPR